MNLSTIKSTLASFNDDKQNTLPDHQIRRLGLIYNAYRFVISVFLFISSYILIFSDNAISVKLPSFLQQSVLLLYGLCSLLLLCFFLVIRANNRRLLLIGMISDVMFISMLLYINGAPDIQLTMLYMVVVAASFILLIPYQAVIITMLAILFVIYQQFFRALTNSINFNDLGQALLISLSFICVGFLSWTLTQRLVTVEKIAEKNAQDFSKLNAITQEVIREMQQGVIVLDAERQIMMSNLATHTLLQLKIDGDYNEFGEPYRSKNNFKANSQPRKVDVAENLSSIYAENYLVKNTITEQHEELLRWLDTASLDRERQSYFIYQLPHSHLNSDKLRVTTTPMQDGITLVMLEDLRREQTNAQQMKLASLGQLTASIAHEIRNPLAAISQASQLLMMDEEEWGSDIKKAPDPNHELYSMIFEQTKRVNRIIEDVLKLSRQAKPEQSKLNIIEWLGGFINNHFREHDVFLHPESECEPKLFFDPHQLEQILINLIDNGLRFSSKAHAHAFVEIDIFCQKNDVIIDVLDSGTGVNHDKQDSLFMPFFTTDNEGTGLGLYLSQAFAEANFSRLTYIPEHEKTCFRLIVPKAMPDIESEV